jgi:hypothetical protein
MYVSAAKITSTNVNTSSVFIYTPFRFRKNNHQTIPWDSNLTAKNIAYLLFSGIG